MSDLESLSEGFFLYIPTHAIDLSNLLHQTPPFAHLNELGSLHTIKDGLLDEDLQITLGFDSISTSWLSRKNNDLDPTFLY
jgi:hypothetical protein